MLLGFGPSLIALQLQANDAFIDLFLSQVGGLRCGEEESSIYMKLQAYGTAIRVVKIRLIGRNEYGSLVNKSPQLP